MHEAVQQTLQLTVIERLNIGEIDFKHTFLPSWMSDTTRSSSL